MHRCAAVFDFVAGGTCECVFRFRFPVMRGVVTGCRSGPWVRSCRDITYFSFFRTGIFFFNWQHLHWFHRPFTAAPGSASLLRDPILEWFYMYMCMYMHMYVHVLKCQVSTQIASRDPILCPSRARRLASAPWPTLNTHTPTADRSAHICALHAWQCLVGAHERLARLNLRRGVDSLRVIAEAERFLGFLGHDGFAEISALDRLGVANGPAEVGRDQHCI